MFHIILDNIIELLLITLFTILVLVGFIRNQSKTTKKAVQLDNPKSDLAEIQEEEESIEENHDETSPDNSELYFGELDDEFNPRIDELRKPLKEYNILLLGETGAGKSTTINAFANYIKHGTFEEAISNDLIQLIASKFVLHDQASGKPIEISFGTDLNETHRRGESSTQGPLGHVFQFEDKSIRIIDTPGMGDTRGAEVDKQNFDQILNYLNLHQNLHGICILVKASETRKTTSFRYCINELLTYLHKSACKNIVFCFTFSRNSFYGAGEGYSTLSDFLANDLKDVKLELNAQNCFFIDNESFRFLVAKKQNYPFKKNQEQAYKESWDFSVEQTNRMMAHILALEPHNLQHTSSLNKARKLILELAEPMVRLQNNINWNIAQLGAEEKRLQTSTETKEELARSLNIVVDDLEKFELDIPITVCTAQKCIQPLRFQGQVKINYVTQCHVNCELKGVDINRIGHPSLQGCAAMDSGKCVSAITTTMKKDRRLGTGCGCAWQKHMHLRCDYKIVKRTIVDTNKEKEFKNTQEAIDTIQEGLNKLKSLITEYQAEFRVIQSVCSKFAYILIQNSNTPYNRFLEPYLNVLIDEEQKKIAAVGDYSRKTHDSLMNMRESHKEQVRILSEAIANKSHENVGIEDVDKCRAELLALKQTGPQFSKMLFVSRTLAKKDLKKMDREIPQRKPMPLLWTIFAPITSKARLN